MNNSSQRDQWSHARKRRVSEQGYSPRSIIPMFQIHCPGLCFISFKLSVTFTQLLTPSVRLFFVSLISPWGIAPREWRWAYGRGVHTVVLMVLWLPPLRYRVSLSGHWWITETGGYTNGTALGHKMNDIFSLPELLELENAAKLNRSDAERLIVLCSMWGPRKNMWDNSIQITTPQCTQG